MFAKTHFLLFLEIFFNRSANNKILKHSAIKKYIYTLILTEKDNIKVIKLIREKSLYSRKLNH